jgi:hypothetical protein
LLVRRVDAEAKGFARPHPSNYTTCTQFECELPFLARL